MYKYAAHDHCFLTAWFVTDFATHGTGNVSTTVYFSYYWIETLLYLRWISHQIFIFENNIYYQATVKDKPIRLVTTGREGVVFNGLPDWLYEGKDAALLRFRFVFYNSSSDSSSLLVPYAFISTETPRIFLEKIVNGLEPISGNGDRANERNAVCSPCVNVQNFMPNPRTSRMNVFLKACIHLLACLSWNVPVWTCCCCFFFFSF